MIKLFYTFICFNILLISNLFAKKTYYERFNLTLDLLDSVRKFENSGNDFKVLQSYLAIKKNCPYLLPRINYDIASSYAKLSNYHKSLTFLSRYVNKDGCTDYETIVNDTSFSSFFWNRNKKSISLKNKVLIAHNKIQSNKKISDTINKHFLKEQYFRKKSNNRIHYSDSIKILDKQGEGIVKYVVEQLGFPNHELISCETMASFMIILIHMDKKKLVEFDLLEKIEKEKKAYMQSYALLMDKVREQNKESQIFFTQLSSYKKDWYDKQTNSFKTLHVCGEYETNFVFCTDCLMPAEKIDRIREKYGLEPIKIYLKDFKINYTK